MLDLWRTEEENFSHCVHAIDADFTNCIHLISLIRECPPWCSIVGCHSDGASVLLYFTLFAKELDSQTCLHIQY